MLQMHMTRLMQGKQEGKEGKCSQQKGKQEGKCSKQDSKQKRKDQHRTPSEMGRETNCWEKI